VTSVHEIVSCESGEVEKPVAQSSFSFVSLLLTRGSFDRNTKRGRSLERYRRAAWTTISSGAARGLTLATMLVSVRLTLHYLGNERYSLWMTITSVVGMLAFADLGLGNGLLNMITECDGRDDRASAARYISSAFVMLSGIAALLAVGFVAVYPFLPWSRIFNLSSALAIQEAGPATAIFVACFILSLPLGVVQRVQLGYQDGFINHVWTALGSLIGFAALLFAMHLRMGLPWLVLAIAGAPVLTLALNGWVLFGIRQPWLRPTLSAFSAETANRIFGVGIAFFIMQVAMTAAYQADNIVVAQILGANMVAQYAVPMKLFMIAPALLSIIVAPLWPAYGEAISRGDIDWVRTAFKRSLVFGLAAMIPANLLLVGFGHQIIHAWVGSQINPSWILLLGLGSWGILNGLNWPLAMFLNGINVVRFQAVCACFNAVLSLLLGILLTRKIGIAGTVYGMVFAQILCILAPLAFYVPRLLHGKVRFSVAGRFQPVA